MKKFMVFAIICAFCVPTLFAQGVSESPKQELIINSYMSDEAPKNAFAAVVAEFEKQNPDIAVTNDFPSSNTIYSSHQTLYPA